MQVSCATIIDPAGGPTTISCHVAPELLKPTSTLIGMRTHSHATMADLAAEAGAGTELIQYLEDRGVRAPATLALLAQDELETVLLQPLLTGWKTKAGSAITLAESEKPIAKAILRHMWNLARSSWQAQLSAARPAAPSAPDPATVTSSGSSTKDDKVPKTLPAGVWSKAIQAYESQQIGGCDRTFPTHELLGAESVLARIHHEITISKLFTPVALGEILQKRTFQASGEPNALAKREAKPTTFTVANDQLIATEEQTWQPRSLLAILDGLASVKWAYILLQIGPEKSVISFFDWAIKLARSRPQKTDQLNQWWTTISWKLALELRGGRTWEEAVGPIQRDYDTFTECMGREPIHIIKNPKLGGKTNTEVNPKGKGKHRQPRPLLMVVRARVGTSRSPRTREPNPVRGRRTTTLRTIGSRTRRARGAVINGTRLGPSPRNRDSTGSLSVLREGHPTTPQRSTQQTNLHQYLWCPTLLTCWGPASSSCHALMALQQDPWRCNRSLAH